MIIIYKEFLQLQTTIHARGLKHTHRKTFRFINLEKTKKAQQMPATIRQSMSDGKKSPLVDDTTFPTACVIITSSCR